jgi:hypothetical protein
LPGIAHGMPVPAGVSRSERVVRVNSCTPSFFSSLAMACHAEGRRCGPEATTFADCHKRADRG